jgi:hypothetical protein
MQFDQARQLTTVETEWPILICLLGSFNLVKAGQPVTVPSGGKT